MNPRFLWIAIVIGWIATSLLTTQADAKSRPKPIPKAQSSEICDHPLKQKQPAPKVLEPILQAHAQWLENRESPDGRAPPYAKPTCGD